MTRKQFFVGWSWFKFNNLRLALRMALIFHTSEAKELKLKVRKFLRLIPTFVEVTGEKRQKSKSKEPTILNRVKNQERRKSLLVAGSCGTATLFQH